MSGAVDTSGSDALRAALAEVLDPEYPVSLVDLGPTLLSLADVPIPAHMQGQPFLGNNAIERE